MNCYRLARGALYLGVRFAALARFLAGPVRLRADCSRSRKGGDTWGTRLCYEPRTSKFPPKSLRSWIQILAC